MNKEFVPYKESLELKELGFNEPCFSFYENGVFIFWYNSVQENDLIQNCIAPLYQQAFNWLYQKLNIENGMMPLDIEYRQLLLKDLIEKVKSKR